MRDPLRVLNTTCPIDGSRVVIEARGAEIASCSRLRECGLSCSYGCARQVELETAVGLARHVQEMFEPPPLLSCGPLTVATWMRVCQQLGGDFLVRV